MPWTVVGVLADGARFFPSHCFFIKACSGIDFYFPESLNAPTERMRIDDRGRELLEAKFNKVFVHVGKGKIMEDKLFGMPSGSVTYVALVVAYFFDETKPTLRVDFGKFVELQTESERLVTRDPVRYMTLFYMFSIIPTDLLEKFVHEWFSMAEERVAEGTSTEEDLLKWGDFTLCVRDELRRLHSFLQEHRTVWVLFSGPDGEVEETYKVQTRVTTEGGSGSREAVPCRLQMACRKEGIVLVPFIGGGRHKEVVEKMCSYMPSYADELKTVFGI